jgi:hypothetical protein
MAELADAADSKSADRKVVGVRPPLPAPDMWLSYQLDTEAILFCAQIVPKMQTMTEIEAESARPFLS